MEKLNPEFPRVPEIISDCILYVRKDRIQDTTGFDLIKLVYLCHSWSLGIYEMPLITERVEAWAYGPMIPSIYNRFIRHINVPIRIDLRVDPMWHDPRLNPNLLTDRQTSLIVSVLDTYGDFNSQSLGAIANQPGSPWDQIRRIYGIGTIIPNQLLQEHYGKLYKEHNVERESVPA